MTTPGEASEAKLAPGVAKWNQLKTAGFSQDELVQWRAQKTDQLRAAGFQPSEVDGYWGASARDPSAINSYVANNIRNTPKVADDPWEQMQAGFGVTAIGLGMNKGAPQYILPEHADLGAKIFSGLGQLTADAPLSIAGWIGGASAGAPVGGAIGGVAGTVVPGVGNIAGAATGATIGGVVGGGAGAGALPVAAREMVMDYYRLHPGATRDEVLSMLAHSAIATGKAAAVGAVTAPLGGLVGGKAASAGANAFLASTADVTTQAVAGTALSGAMDGKMPDSTDFVAALAVGLAPHGANLIRGGRPTAGGRSAQHNAEEIYRQTGATPHEAAQRASTNAHMRQELMQQDVNGDPVFPAHRREAPSQIEPFVLSKEAKGGEDAKNVTPKPEEAPPTTTHRYEELAQAQQPKRATSIDDAVGFLYKLEGSGEKSVSPAGARGRGQIMPGTARQYGFDPDQLFDPAYNEKVMRAIVTDLHKQAHGDMEAIAIGYNAGPGRMGRFLKSGPGNRLEASLDKNAPNGIRYEKVPAARDEAWLPLETQKYLANLRRRGGGSGKGPPPPPEGPQAAGGEPGGPIVPFGKRETPPAPLEPETTQGQREDWGSKSAADRYKAADELIGDEQREGFLDLVSPSRVIDQYVSELRPARDVDNAIFKAHPEMDRNKVYGIEDAYRNTYASDDRASLMIQHGPVDGYTNEFAGTKDSASLKAAVRALTKAGGNVKDWRSFMLAARTVEKTSQGIPTGMDPELAKSIVTDPKEMAKYKDAVKLFQQTGHGVLNYAVAKGRYSEEQVNRMVSQNLFWVSMRRVQGDHDAFKPGGRGSFRVGRGVMKMEGSDKQVIDPIMASIDNWRMIVADADRNEAAGIVVSAAQGGLIPPEWGIKHVGVLGDGELSKKTDLAPYVAPDEVVGLTQALAPDLAIQAFKASGKPNEFLYFRNGKAEIWATESPQLARLLRGAESAAEANIILQGMQGVAALKRAGITSMPDFAAKTTVGDQIGAWINDPHHPPPIITLALGVIPALTRNATWKNWVAAGGAGASAVAMDRNFLTKDMAGIFEETGATQRVWNTLRSPYDLAQIIQERIDAAQRIGYSVYTQGVKGVDARKSAMLGRKAYVDFKEKATLQMVNTLAKITPFLRPALLGLKNTGEAFATRPIDTALHLGIAGVVIAGLAALNLQNDADLPEDQKWRNMDQWKRDMFITTPEIAGIRFKVGTRDALGIVNMTVNRFMDHWQTHDRHAFDHYWSNFFKGILPSMTPAFAQPALEAETNHNMFTGHSLIPASLENASGPMQYTEATTGTAKSLARWIGDQPAAEALKLNSPVVIDNYIRGYLGTGGLAIARILNAPDPGQVKPSELADNPFIAGFVHRTTGAGAQPIQDFYDAYDKVKAAQTDVKLAMKRRDMGEFKEARQNMLASVNAAAVSEALRQHQTQITAIYKNEDMTVDEKRQASEALYSRMIVVAKRGLQIIDKRQDMMDARDLRPPAGPQTSQQPPAPAAQPAAPLPGANAGNAPIS